MKDVFYDKSYSKTLIVTGITSSFFTTYNSLIPPCIIRYFNMEKQQVRDNHSNVSKSGEIKY